MIRSLLHGLQPFFLLSVFITTFTDAQSSADSGYTGYSLSLSGDDDSVLYSTANTAANASSAFPPPDVFLNATVNVGEIDINVSNLTAKINLDAQVLQLQRFNAGVDLSIDRVSLLIQNVSAKVLLEARLENLVRMIDDTLSSIDLNPVLATLGQDVGSLLGSTVDGLTGGGDGGSGGGGSSPLPSIVTPRSYELDNNILYSMNDYSGNTHTNRILTQSGSIVDEFLDNDGNTQMRQAVGSYLGDMAFNGYSRSTVVNGQEARELEYVYTPLIGVSVVSAVYLDASDNVLATKVLSESSGGGSSTVGGP